MTTIGSLESTTVNVSPRWRSKFRSNQLICHIDVSAFAGVLFVVVFVYQLGILTPKNICTSGVMIHTPKVQSASPMGGALKEDALIIGILRDQRIFFCAGAVSAEQLPARIREAVAHGAENKVYIRADARSKFASVENVLDAVRAAGVENIAFITDQRRPAASQ